MQDQNDPVSTVQSGVDLALQNVGGCVAASASTVHARHKVAAPASTDEMAMIADRLQYETGEGPRLSAILEEETVCVPGLAQLDSRTIIAQACELVPQRFSIGSIRAFSLLSPLSQTQNVTLRDIAAELVITRRLPAHTR